MLSSNDLLRLAELAAREAAEYLRAAPRPAPDRWEAKGLNDFVTAVDRGAEELIARRLLAAAPAGAIVGEELTPGASVPAGLAWIAIFGGMVAASLLCAPVIALTIWLNVSANGDEWTWLLLPVGAAYGATITWLGLRLAAPRTAAHLPEILTAVSKG